MSPPPGIEGALAVLTMVFVGVAATDNRLRTDRRRSWRNSRGLRRRFQARLAFRGLVIAVELPLGVGGRSRIGRAFVGEYCGRFLWSRICLGEDGGLRPAEVTRGRRTHRVVELVAAHDVAQG